jgi:hypothetical protein
MLGLSTTETPLMTAPRKVPEPVPEHPPAICPTCRDNRFVKKELVLTGTTAMSFWTCSSCLRSWSAPPPRMAKADLKDRPKTARRFGPRTDR